MSPFFLWAEADKGENIIEEEVKIHTGQYVWLTDGPRVCVYHFPAAHVAPQVFLTLSSWAEAAPAGRTFRAKNEFGAQTE